MIEPIGAEQHKASDKWPYHGQGTRESGGHLQLLQGAFAHHRCLVPADGWYEWLPVDDRKRPHFLCREDREPIWLAGIWSGRPDGKPGCAILTEPARGVAADIHSRMPLALDDESLEPWLDPHLTDREAIRQVVHHLPAELIIHWHVSTRVNRSANDDASLIQFC
ncbi:SOS response-associated peptidase [Halomonas litopenaei]|nr:SOS response-associated peptidase [Halomonas litopenaei]